MRTPASTPPLLTPTNLSYPDPMAQRRDSARWLHPWGHGRGRVVPGPVLGRASTHATHLVGVHEPRTAPRVARTVGGRARVHAASCSAMRFRLIGRRIGVRTPVVFSPARNSRSTPVSRATGRSGTPWGTSARTWSTIIGCPSGFRAQPTHGRRRQHRGQPSTTFARPTGRRVP